MRASWIFALIFASVFGAAVPAIGITTSSGQSWTFVPDAWVRGNTIDSSYFGWDSLEGPPIPNAPFGSFKLDDTTPDLGVGTTALSPRFVQSNGSLAIYGHRSSSNNYYSGFPDTIDGFPANAAADDTFSATAPASGVGGFTTVVLQAIGGVGQAVSDLDFQMTTAGWVKQKDLYGNAPGGGGLHWQEWTAPGNDLAFAIQMTSPNSSRSLDAFQIDTFWSPNAAVVNARSGIPEPSTLALAAFIVAPLARRRRPR